MARKVIIDCDPGIDDAVALCLALFDPRLEVIAITATAGNVHAERASQNVQAIVEQLDPPRYPRIGKASVPDVGESLARSWLHGEDGLGNAGFVVSRLHHQHPSEKIIIDEIRAAPGEVTVICLGPLSNLARAFQRDPALPGMVDRILMSGGALNGIGDITPSAEFNIHWDPDAARSVFRSPTTKTLVPLDVSHKMTLTLDFLDDLPGDETRAGAFLRKVLPFLFRSHHQHLGQEGIHLHDALTIMAAVQPELFTTVELAGDVETRGQLTTGATIFDRRSHGEWRANMEVVTDVDVPTAINSIVRGLVHAGRGSN